MHPPPLSKNGHGQKNNGHTGSSCLDKPVLARDTQHKKTVHIENLPSPQTKQAILMAGNHRKRDSIGLQYQSECCCEEEEPSQT